MTKLLDIGREVRRTFWNRQGEKVVGRQPRSAKPRYGFGGCVANQDGYLAKHTFRPFLQKFEKLWPHLFLGFAGPVFIHLFSSRQPKKQATRIMKRGTGSYDRHVSSIESMSCSS